MHKASRSSPLFAISLISVSVVLFLAHLYFWLSASNALDCYAGHVVDGPDRRSLGSATEWFATIKRLLTPLTCTGLIAIAGLFVLGLCLLFCGKEPRAARTES